MSKIAFLFPMNINQLYVWKRLGVNAISSSGGVWIRLDNNHRPVMNEEIRQKLADAVPVYEEDFEVLLAMVEDTNLTDNFIEGRGSEKSWVPLGSLTAVFPISNRGARMLPDKLDSSTPLRDPLIIPEIGDRETAWYSKSRVESAETLVLALQLGNTDKLNPVIEESALDVMANRVNSSAGFVKKVVRYARQIRPGSPMITNDDYGYFSDLGRILADLNKGSRSADDKKILKSLRAALDSNRAASPNASLSEIATMIADELDALREQCAPLSPFSAVVFFKVRDLLQDLNEGFIDELANLVRPIGEPQRAAMAVGIRLAGMFVGFATVSEVTERIQQKPVSFDPIPAAVKSMLPHGAPAEDTPGQKSIIRKDSKSKVAGENAGATKTKPKKPIKLEPNPQEDPTSESKNGKSDPCEAEVPESNPKGPEPDASDDKIQDVAPGGLVPNTEDQDDDRKKKNETVPINDVSNTPPEVGKSAESDPEEEPVQENLFRENPKLNSNPKT